MRRVPRQGGLSHNGLLQLPQEQRKQGGRKGRGADAGTGTRLGIRFGEVHAQDPRGRACGAVRELPSRPQRPRHAEFHRTTLFGLPHQGTDTAGVCIDCHKTENAKSFSNDIEFARAVLPHDQATIDTAKAQLVYGKDPQMRQLAQEIITDRQSETSQVEQWLKDHEASTWAPVKCRDCHKKANNPN